MRMDGRVPPVVLFVMGILALLCWFGDGSFEVAYNMTSTVAYSSKSIYRILTEGREIGEKEEKEDGDDFGNGRGMTVTRESSRSEKKVCGNMVHFLYRQ